MGLGRCGERLLEEYLGEFAKGALSVGESVGPRFSGRSDEVPKLRSERGCQSAPPDPRNLEAQVANKVLSEAAPALAAAPPRGFLVQRNLRETAQSVDRAAISHDRVRRKQGARRLVHKGHEFVRK